MSHAENSQVLEVIQFLALVHERFKRFRRQVAEAFRTNKLDYRIECNNYESGLIVSAYLEVDIDPSRSVVWWLDITPSDGVWNIDPSVRLNGQDVIVPLNETNVSDLMKNRNVVLEKIDALFDTLPIVIQEITHTG